MDQDNVTEFPVPASLEKRLVELQDALAIAMEDAEAQTKEAWRAVDLIKEKIDRLMRVL